MADQLQENMLFSCVHEQHFGTEQMVIHHALSIVISGRMEIFTPEGSRFFEEGEMGIMRKNTLLKTRKHPSADGKPFKSFTIFLTEDFLRQFGLQNNIPVQERFTGNPLYEISRESFIHGFFQSLIPYFDKPDFFTSKMAALKTEEAIELLLRLDQFFYGFLFDFSEPFKIDLEAFMQKNYLFNIPIIEFARLSGRSLSTFKRDFAKTFGETPERWLKQKRLAEARNLLQSTKLRPSDVYLHVGFENFSHFSNAFKNYFGYNASTVTNS
ncbi:MAG: transcriptional regulator, AraC family [Fluviicola sp.]|jgi:AraC-like DNA-binding protein|uniref:helix-turn-helix domain-containing protein n=1 Tax=Fluviicola sp. TaxID=1917219 RepID=UPI00261ED3F5|nr:AraC family transcriptional regulator [Fluviicola sp.]MDF3027760.1 transcriptional regulator, AraC family [Fluviicola sp.]